MDGHIAEETPHDSEINHPDNETVRLEFRVSQEIGRIKDHSDDRRQSDDNRPQGSFPLPANGGAQQGENEEDKKRTGGSLCQKHDGREDHQIEVVSDQAKLSSLLSKAPGCRG